MEQPVADPFGHPGHGKRSTRLKHLRDDERLAAVVEWNVAQAITQAVDFKVEAMQVQRMDLRAEIDDPPPNGLAELVRQALGRRPGQAVDQEHERGSSFRNATPGSSAAAMSRSSRGVRLVQSVMTSTRSSSWRRSRRIDDERA